MARLGTVDDQGRPHLVPVVFVVEEETLYSATDAGERLAKRLRNIQRDPRVMVLIDVYDEDWSTIWWGRLRGTGRVVEHEPERDHARELLWDKYPQFKQAPPAEAGGPVMAVDIAEWSGWAYSS